MRVYYLDPIVEQSSKREDGRKQNAKAICDFLEGHGDRKSYFDSVANFLNGPSYHTRLVKYLPFIFPDKGEHDEFDQALARAWNSQIDVIEDRENFCQFNIPSFSDPQTVIKAFHLIPWYYAAGYIELQDLVESLFRCVRKPNRISAKSLAEAIYFCYSYGLLAESDYRSLQPIVNRYFNAPTLDTATIKDNHHSWSKFLELTAHASLSERPLPALECLEQNLNDIPTPRSENEYIIIHGSQIFHGLFDHSPYCFDEKNGTVVNLASPQDSTILLNSVWISTSEHRAENLRTRLKNFQLAPGENRQDFADKPSALIFLDQLEQELLQDLIKTGNFQSPNLKSSEIDASSPFYNPIFREFTTELFLKKFTLPQSDSSNRGPF